MATPFATYTPGIDAPAVGAFAITPADADLSSHIRKVTIGGTAGVIVYMGWDGVIYTTNTLPVGDYPLLAKQIRAATTATTLTGWV